MLHIDKAVYGSKMLLEMQCKLRKELYKIFDVRIDCRHVRYSDMLFLYEASE